jgi:CRISPR-associated protein Cmr1
MPPPIRRARRGEAARESFSVEIETVTPILGGAPMTRAVDEVDFIRVPTIRGHLRFWWRALQRGGFATPGELYRAEAALWGKGRRRQEWSRRPLPGRDNGDPRPKGPRH